MLEVIFAEFKPKIHSWIWSRSNGESDIGLLVSRFINNMNHPKITELSTDEYSALVDMLTFEFEGQLDQIYNSEKMLVRK